MNLSMTLTDEMNGYIDSEGIMAFSFNDTWPEFIRSQVSPKSRPSPQWIAFTYPISEEKSTSQATEFVSSEWETENSFIPRTTLGKRLLTLRAKAIAAGMRLLTEDEVLEEVKRRRGEVEDNETDLY